MKGLPGPLIKFFEKSIGLDGVYKLGEVFGNKAVAKCVIGYFNDNDIKFFEGMIDGIIVSPRGENGFGWDPIFQPSGQNKTLAQIKNKGGGGIRNKIFAGYCSFKIN